MTATEPIADPSAPPGPLLRLVGDQRVTYLLVGAFNTVNSFAIFALSQVLLGHVIGYMGSLLVSHVVSVLCSFFMQRRLVWRVHGHLLLDLARFETVNLGALGLNAVLLPALVELVGMSPIPAQVVAGVVSIGLTYFAHRTFSFRRRPGAAG